jgi:hypothetical protein
LLLAAFTALITLSSTVSALRYNETLDAYNVNKNRGEFDRQPGFGHVTDT